MGTRSELGTVEALLNLAKDADADKAQEGIL